MLVIAPTSSTSSADRPKVGGVSDYRCYFSAPRTDKEATVELFEKCERAVELNEAQELKAKVVESHPWR